LNDRVETGLRDAIRLRARAGSGARQGVCWILRWRVARVRVPELRCAELLEDAVKISMLVTTILATTFAVAAFSQAVPAAKESGKAVAESTKEAGDNVKAAGSREPNKSVNKSKAHAHKAKAHAHAHRAKADAKAAVK
jgi:hypothetical protein